VQAAHRFSQLAGTGDLDRDLSQSCRAATEAMVALILALVWMLLRERAVALAATGVRLSGGLTFYRKGFAQR
jgi:hypothetical protein